MKWHLVFFNLLRGSTAMGLIMLFFIVVSTELLALLLSLGTINVSRLNLATGNSASLDFSQKNLLLAVTPSPTIPSVNTAPSQDVQEQRVLTEAQDAISAADTVIYWS